MSYLWVLLRGRPCLRAPCCRLALCPSGSPPLSPCRSLRQVFASILSYCHECSTLAFSKSDHHPGMKSVRMCKKSWPVDSTNATPTSHKTLRKLFVNRRNNAYPRCADHFSQVDVHPVVAADQMPVVSFAIFQLHQL